MLSMDITFLIPVRIDSQSRYNNAKKSLEYLCHYAPYNIFIVENSEHSIIPEILKSIDTNNAKIDYEFIKNSDELFHKTKLLNLMLSKATSEVVVNYDIDIILHSNAYKFCYDLIVNQNYDLVYPFAKGDYLLNIFGDHHDKFKFDLSKIKPEYCELKICQHGLCQFLNRKQYTKYGGMNENFISYGPEDWELGYRFSKFDLKVDWINTFIVHLDHSRGINSGTLHSMAKSNYDLYEWIQTLKIKELKEYYDVK